MSGLNVMEAIVVDKREVVYEINPVTICLSDVNKFNFNLKPCAFHYLTSLNLLRNTQWQASVD